MKKCLLDASSAILLARVGLHETLAETYELISGRTVLHEITAHNRPGSTSWKKLYREQALQLKDCPAIDDTSALSKLGPGEREILQLFLQGQGDFVMTDDGKAAKFCKRKKIPFINALLFPLVLLHTGIISHKEQKDFFDKIAEIGRYSKYVIRIGAQCSPGDIDFCLPSITNS